MDQVDAEAAFEWRQRAAGAQTRQAGCHRAGQQNGPQGLAIAENGRDLPRRAGLYEDKGSRPNETVGCK